MDILQVAKVPLPEWKLPVLQWPSLVEFLQNIASLATSQRLVTVEKGVAQSAMALLRGPKFSALMKRLKPIRKFRNMEPLNAAEVREGVNIMKLQESLNHIDKDLDSTDTAG